MNAKLYSVAQLILKELDRIEDITIGVDTTEFYFIYKDTIFSILKREEPIAFGLYSLYLYPKAKDIGYLKDQFEGSDPETIFMLSMHANESTSYQIILAKIYNEVYEKYLGLDELFENLLS